MKTVFITGAASGIGLATATHLYQQGWSVGLVDLNLDALDKLTADWEQGRTFCYEVDVTDAAQLKQAISDFASNHHQTLDVLINNAGILNIGLFEDISIAQHSAIIDINIKGVIYGCHAALPYLKNTKRSMVINLSSASSVYGTPELASYSATKFAIKGLTEALELEWRSYGISVCDVMPPYVATNMVSSQQRSCKSIERLGVNITANDVVKVIMKQINQPSVHRSVGWSFTALNCLSAITPSFMLRGYMKWISRP